MNINDVYNLVLFITNRSQTGNTGPARFNYAADMANISLFKRYCGIPEEYQPGSPISKMAFSITGDIEKVARIFKVDKPLYIDPATGKADVPDNFEKESTMTYYTQKNGDPVAIEVDICNDTEFQEKLTSYVVPADMDNPACRFIGTKIEFAPKTLVTSTLTYLRKPVKPVWGYTFSSNRPVYSSNASTDPEWPDTVLNDFVLRICQFLGINMERNTLVQQMEAFKQLGN